MARLLIALTAAAVLAAGTAYGWYQWRLQPVRLPLEADWGAVVTVIAGDGIAGVRDGHPSQARFSDPFGVVAAPDGSIYVADAGDAQAVRRLAPDGTVSTVADGFDTPSAVALGPQGSLYVADTGHNVIKRIDRDAAGQVTVSVVGKTELNGPVGLAVAADGRVIVADTYNDRIRVIAADGSVTTVAGSGVPGWADGPAEVAQFDTPCGVAIDAAGNIYVADTGNDAVRRISPSGSVTTLPPPAEGLFRPVGIDVTDDGIVYVTDDRGRIVEIRPDVRARTVAGTRPGYADGAGEDARFRGPSGVAVAGPGRLVVADTRNALIRLVAARSQVDLRPPASPFIAPSFDADTFGLLPLVWPFDSLDGPYEITGTMGEARGGEGMERFHAGLDVSGDQGMDVFAIRDGVVQSPVAVTSFDTLGESVRIGPITYVHLRVGRHSRDEPFASPAFVQTYAGDGHIVRVRVRRGTRFRTGEAIGTLNAFNHAHLNVGWPAEEHNPLRFRLPYFDDTVAPTIEPSGVRLFAEDGTRMNERLKGRLLVSGRVRIVVDAWDQVDGNEPRRRLGLYSAGYQVLHANRVPLPGFESPRTTIVFDRFSPDGDDAAGLVFDAGSGIPFFGARRTRFLYVVTNTYRDGVATPGYWDTTELQPGNYILRVVASDIRGNVALANRDVPITIEGISDF